MATVRLMPPGDGLHGTIRVPGGRSYTCAVGSTIDVPDFDAPVMVTNGWAAVAGTSGATAARPTNPKKGDSFHDSTLGVTIVYDGKVWRDPATGNAV